MKKKSFQFAVILFVFCAGFSFFTMNAAAIEWDGSTSGGGGTGGPAGPNGYAVRSTDNNVSNIGYRFSVVDKNGNNKGKVVDVFRNTSGGNAAINRNYKFNSKLNKKQLINGQNGNYGTSKNSTDCVKESNMGFTSALPSPNGIKNWQNNETNLNAILSALNVGRLNNLKNGDKILVEPLWDVRLESVYHSCTVTEIAIYGKHILGASSNGGSSNVSESWGFISQYTNRHWPNALFTPDGQNLWNGVSAIGSSSRGSFYDIINKGYGAGIAYTETRPDFTPVLNVKVCEAWRDSKSTRTFHYGTSNGSAFGNYTYANGYPIMGENIWFSVHFPAETENVSVRQYVRIKGGSWTTRDVTLSSASSTQWFDASFQPTKIESGRSSYIIEAKTDWMNGNTVLKSGAVKTFYIPIKPKINRYQVTYFDINNNQVARKGTAGSSGSAYVGQKIYPRYTYTSSSTWASNNNFSNTINGTTDLNISNTSINYNANVERYSSYSPYVVPNVARLPHVLSTSWSTDTARTREKTTINIPVIKADVELVEIRLIDETTGNYVTGNKLWVHQKVTPQYVYRNNSSVRIYVEGYDNDRSRIGSSTIYGINANSQILVNGKQITVGNVPSQSFWGGVFLDGAGINNTSWESNGTNNTKTSTYTVEHPLRIQTITPNSLYREKTVVITSFTVQNLAHFNFTPNYNISVKFTSLNGSTSIYTASKSPIVIPANGENLVWFRWTVPSGLNGATLTLKGNVIDGGIVVGTKSMTRGTEKQPASSTPDTQFEKAAPSGFSIVRIPTRTGQTSARWSEWVYESNAFVKKTYGLQLAAAAPSITPDVNSPSRSYTGGTWRMSSGYGFTLSLSTHTQTLSGTTVPAAASYTAVQAASLYFPEFRYSNTVNNYRVLDKNGSNKFRFPVNPNAKDRARLHFTPLYYPNGNYQCQGFINDAWTPAGMLSGYYNSNTMTISGSAYDDWYVAGK